MLCSNTLETGVCYCSVCTIYRLKSEDNSKLHCAEMNDSIVYTDGAESCLYASLFITGFRVTN